MQIHIVGNFSLVEDLAVVLENDILPRMVLFLEASKMTYCLVKV